MAKIGTGAFGEVNLVKYRRNNLIYALKILKKLNEKDMKVIT
jgi:serine/threonine protein kinase